VIRSFDDAATQDIFNGLDTKHARRFGKDLWRAIRRRLASIDAATGLDDLTAIPGYRLEALRGD
jgi:proteic killer suppression protein